jgi:eukaryotic-like serine/threonine-protein kinase
MRFSSLAQPALVPCLVLPLLLTGVASAQSPAPSREREERRLVLPSGPDAPLPEVRLASGVSTWLRFDSPLDKSSVELEGRAARFREVDVGERTLLLVPSVEPAPGERLGLRVRFRDGSSPSHASFALVSHPSRVDKELEVVRQARPLEALVPTPPRQLNPRAPRSLSDIAMRLLEKRPEDRYPSAEALQQALWESAKERKSLEWKQPLVRSDEELPEEASVEAVRRRLARKLKDSNEARSAPTPVEEAEEHTRPEVETPPAEEPGTQEAPPPTSHGKRGRWLAAVLASGLLIGLLLFASWRAWGTFGPPLQPGSPPVPTSSVSPDSASSSQRGASREVLLTALLCGFFSVGCTAAPVKPPQRGEDCPAEARHFMFKELKISPGSELKAVLDIHQPGDQSQEGTYREGPLLSRVSAYSWADPGLPAGTLLYGYLWTGPGYHYFGKDDAVIGRYTEALLPDGRRGPICMVIGGPNDGLAPRLPGSTPEAIQLPRELPVSAVRRWP